MCIKAPKQPAIRAAPTPNPNNPIVQANRARSAEQQGITENIFTSALGDSAYNTSASSPALARFGA